jgi:hypothetical protein
MALPLQIKGVAAARCSERVAKARKGTALHYFLERAAQSFLWRFQSSRWCSAPQ